MVGLTPVHFGTWSFFWAEFLWLALRQPHSVLLWSSAWLLGFRGLASSFPGGLEPALNSQPFSWGALLFFLPFNQSFSFHPWLLPSWHQWQNQLSAQSSLSWFPREAGFLEMCKLHSLPRASLAFGNLFHLIKKITLLYNLVFVSLSLLDNAYHSLMTASLKPKDWLAAYY